MRPTIDQTFKNQDFITALSNTHAALLKARKIAAKSLLQSPLKYLLTEITCYSAITSPPVKLAFNSLLDSVKIEPQYIPAVDTLISKYVGVQFIITSSWLDSLRLDYIEDHKNQYSPVDGYTPIAIRPIDCELSQSITLKSCHIYFIYRDILVARKDSVDIELHLHKRHHKEPK